MRRWAPAGNNGLIPLDVHIDPSTNLLTGTFGNTTYNAGAAYTKDETKFGYGALNATGRPATSSR
jgi:hypothetical protein